jgi:DNA mismatch repair protein MutS
MKMMAINTILAQIGCNVPAVGMVLCPFDHLFLRMGVRDSMLKSESTSLLERKQTQYIIDYGNASKLMNSHLKFTCIA